MNEYKQIKNDDSQSDELKILMDNLTILSNRINMKLLEFEKEINIEGKKLIINDLNSLLIKFQEMFKLVQNEYCLNSQEVKKLYLTKFKQFFRIYKTHCENIVQKRNIYNILKEVLA